jgi:hypothetical protein
LNEQVKLHDPVYQQCLDAAKRDYDALYPELQKVQGQIINLRRLIHAISGLLEIEVDEAYDWTSSKPDTFSSRPQFKKRSDGRYPKATQERGATTD